MVEFARVFVLRCGYQGVAGRGCYADAVSRWISDEPCAAIHPPGCVFFLSRLRVRC